MPITRAGLIARHTFPDALAAMTDAAAWLDAHGCAPMIETVSGEAAGLTARWPMAPRETLASAIDVLVAFGGDGTLLDAAGVLQHAPGDVPLLGVNLGHLGFLTEVSPDELVPALEALLAGRARTETRLMLSGAVRRRGVIVAEHRALNDIVVTRGALSRMIEIDVSADDALVCHVRADGLIVATATGSTAYNLSAGGPIVHPSVDALILTPVAPHTLTNRPLVLPATLEITLRPDIDPSRTDIVATFDGQQTAALETGDAVEIRRSPRALRLIKTATRSHFDMLREKLRWAET
jgi:NAD+ kinase